MSEVTGYISYKEYILDVMIDIETLGTLAGDPVTSVGVSVFDAKTGEFHEEFFIKMDIREQLKLGSVINYDTLCWWLEQDVDVMRKNIVIKKDDDITSIENLWRILETIRRKYKDPNVWAHSPLFDVANLEDKFRRVGITDMPWSFRKVRCTRTIYDLAGLSLGPTPDKHDALADAHHQADRVIEAYKVLKLNTK